MLEAVRFLIVCHQDSFKHPSGLNIANDVADSPKHRLPYYVLSV